MQTFTTEQIEARALELHKTRNANARRNGWMMQVYSGDERAFCLEAAAHGLSMEAHDAAKAEAEIARWSRVSTSALKAMIEQLEAERSNVFYRMATHTAIQERDLDELTRMRTEYTRRLQVKIAADDAATDAALAESAARLADMRAPVRGADLSRNARHAMAAE